MAKSAKERVQLSADALDQVKPGWATKVTKPINLKSSCTCVLGQVFGDFYEGMPVMQKAGFWNEEIKSGFFLKPFSSGDFEDMMDHWSMQGAWRAAIKKRMKNAPKAAEQIAA